MMDFLILALVAYAVFALALFILDRDSKLVWYSTASAPPYTYVWLIVYILVLLPLARINR